MEEMKHTPGPWKARKGFHADTIEIFHPDKSVKPPFYPCEIATIASDRDTAKAKANARLIAAAPELLEALKLAANALDKMGDMPYSDVSTHAWFSLDCEKIVEDSKSLIAKSTGQSK